MNSPRTSVTNAVTALPARWRIALAVAVPFAVPMMWSRTAHAQQQYALTDLGTFVGTSINASGQMAGYAYTTTANGAPYHAFLYSNGSMQDLGTFGGTDSSANGINTSGQVTGWAYTTGNFQRAFLYSNGKMTDLNTLDTSSSLAMYVTLTSASAINDRGWIVASGIDSRTGTSHSYLLSDTPVPLPATAWLMLSGLVGLGGLSRRRRMLTATFGWQN